MLFNEFKERLFELAKEAGFSEYEIYYVKGEECEIWAYNGEIDKYDVNSTIGLSFRGLYNGKIGYSYTEILDEESAAMLVQNAKENAQIIENDDIEIIYGEKDQYMDINCFNEELSKVDTDRKISLALELEKEAKKQSDKVTGVQYCVVSTSEGEKKIVNSKGLDLSFKSNIAYGILGPVVQLGKKMNSAAAFEVTRKLEEISPKKLAEESVNDALAFMDADSVESGSYKVALRNDAASEILCTFGGIFFADNVQKGLSLLKDKEGSIIASDIVTIIDDPLMENGVASAPFDDEGVAAYTKEVVKDGVLCTLLYNLKTAYKDNRRSTGNGSKASYASPVEIAASNFYIKPRDKDLTEILKELKDGLLITEVQGLHSGANPISGDFSLAAKGFLIRDGKKARPVEQITISGNFYKLLQNIELIGSDLKFGIPGGTGCFGSPTIVVKEVKVSGK